MDVPSRKGTSREYRHAGVDLHIVFPKVKAIPYLLRADDLMPNTTNHARFATVVWSFNAPGHTRPTLLESLNRASELLSTHKNVVSLFPAPHYVTTLCMQRMW